jgi:hypothetical protein
MQLELRKVEGGEKLSDAFSSFVEAQKANTTHRAKMEEKAEERESRKEAREARKEEWEAKIAETTALNNQLANLNMASSTIPNIAQTGLNLVEKTSQAIAALTEKLV